MTLQARGYERRWLAILICGLALNFGGNLWAIPRWGALGAATATLASEVVLLVLTAVLAGKTLGMFFPLKPVVVGLSATVTGGLAMWLLQDGGPWLATLAALLVYGAILVVFRVVNAADGAMLISWVREVVPKWSHG